MERNNGDQLNKVFEAYCQASIERDCAKKELQQTNVYYERHTQKLQKQIEDQQQLISKLKAQLISATKQPSGEVKGEAAPRKQEEETLSPSNHFFDNPGSSLRKIHDLKENMETAVIVSSSPHAAPVASSFENKDVLEVFQALQGKFQQIRTLTQRQKYHLKKIYRGNDMANEQQFSMPIQCTDVTVEQAERSFPSALRPVVDLQHPPTILASRGASPEDSNLVDSLTTLSIKFPPSTDSEYEFLNSAPEKHIDLSMPRKQPAVSSVSAVIEEPAMELAIPFLYPTSVSHPPSPSTSLSHESVRRPKQPLRSPELWDATTAAAAQAVSVEQQQQINNNSPDICTFCNAVVPQDHMKSHLYNHC
ncbi:uncharacterized protein LOC121551997 [Coregonus clupeaformis]|uniref:uncharacterized protein LOC121551997 n=1 Tax=Coregonus clupeaformis TaxID=59861 RepID=UPI001BE0035F|nr:uncharacterized protein LOC121551997 [Coregonus clupeaformis]